MYAVSPPAFAHIGWKFYLVFAICGFTNAFTVWALFPETKVCHIRANLYLLRLNETESLLRVANLRKWTSSLNIYLGSSRVPSTTLSTVTQGRTNCATVSFTVLIAEKSLD